VRAWWDYLRSRERGPVVYWLFHPPKKDTDANLWLLVVGVLPWLIAAAVVYLVAELF
jgi:hypothetical protein